MKYEMIFGDERLFDGAPEDAEMITKPHGNERAEPFFFKFINSRVYGCSNKCKTWEWCEYPANTTVALRRIIPEPNRWTQADKDAGRLPEVGSIFTYRDETLTCHFIDGDGEIWAHDIDNKIVTPLLMDCQPIETPAEKAQREEDEFVSEHDESLLGVVCMDSSHRKCYELGKRAAYRKLKGGE